MTSPKVQPIIIFGIGDYAELIHWYLKHDSPYDVVAFTLDREYIEVDQFLGLPVVPFDEMPTRYPATKYQMFVALGYRNVNQLRAQKYLTCKELGYSFISYVNSTVINQANVPIGDNCFIFENVVLQPFSTIGNNVIIWSSSVVAHHSQIQDHCFIAHNVAISGHVMVEPYSFIGGNATIRDQVTIASRTVIGLGVTILHSTTEGSVYKSSPPDTLRVDSNQLKGL